MKSGKYLTIIPDQLAKDERENTRISLDPNGNAFSWLQISPRFKIDKEGDKVRNSSELYLKVAERANEFIHTADRNPLPGKFKEVNCAFESTSWKLCIYQSSVDASDRSLLLASQLVYISDPETRSAISTKQRPLKSLDDEHSHDEAEELGEESEDGENAVGAVILEAMSHSDHFNSNYLWFVYKHTLISGGPIYWKTDLVRFRHMNSGRYMCLIVRTVERNGMSAEDLSFSTTDDPEAQGTLFSISEINSNAKALGNGKAVQIGQGGVWLERGEVTEDKVFTYEVKGTRDKTNALSLLISRYDQVGGQKVAAVATAEQEKEEEPLDVFSGLSACYHLNRLNDMIVVPKNELINTILPLAGRSDIDFFQLVADKIVYFSQGFPISAVNVQLGIDKGDQRLVSYRQSLLREQGVLERVLKVIKKLVPMTERLERTKANQNKRKKTKTTDEEMAAINMAQMILRKAFSIIYYSILQNEDNQMLVADFMPVLLAHLNSQPLAGKCVTEMLSKNIELQETKIGT
ncbi:hypothetical protein EON65_25415, partial [archaeon]